MQSIWKKYPNEKPDDGKTCILVCTNTEAPKNSYIGLITRERFYSQFPWVNQNIIWCYETDLLQSLQTTPVCEGKETDWLANQIKQIENPPKNFPHLLLKPNQQDVDGLLGEINKQIYSLIEERNFTTSAEAILLLAKIKQHLGGR